MDPRIKSYKRISAHRHWRKGVHENRHRFTAPEIRDRARFYFTDAVIREDAKSRNLDNLPKKAKGHEVKQNLLNKPTALAALLGDTAAKAIVRDI